MRFVDRQLFACQLYFIHLNKGYTDVIGRLKVGLERVSSFWPNLNVRSASVFRVETIL